MAFENKTVEAVNNLIIAGLETELNTTFRLLPKSFVRVLAKVCAGTFITLYKQQAWMFLQMFVDTATFDEVEVLGHKVRPLVLWGELVGIGSPSSATQWTGTMKVKVTAVNTYLEKGVQLKNSATGKIYVVTENKLLANAYEYIFIKCAEAGTAGNLEVGDKLVTVSPLSNVDRVCEVTSSSVIAVDSESEGAYRARVKNRWREQPQGGSLSDYRRWASEVPGVLNTYIYKDDESAAGVLVYVAVTEETSADRVPSAAKLLEVGSACDYDPETGLARRPVGAVIDPAGDGTYTNIRAVEVVKFDVYITGFVGNELADFKTKSKENLKQYFQQREPYVRGLSVDSNRTDRISVSNLIGIENEIAESVTGYFEGIVLKKEETSISSYTLDRGELAALKDLYVNGAKV